MTFPKWETNFQKHKQPLGNKTHGLFFYGAAGGFAGYKARLRKHPKRGPTPSGQKKQPIDDQADELFLNFMCRFHAFKKAIRQKRYAGSFSLCDGLTLHIFFTDPIRNGAVEDVRINRFGQMVVHPMLKGFTDVVGEGVRRHGEDRNRGAV